MKKYVDRDGSDIRLWEDEIVLAPVSELGARLNADLDTHFQKSYGWSPKNRIPIELQHTIANIIRERTGLAVQEEYRIPNDADGHSFRVDIFVGTNLAIHLKAGVRSLNKNRDNRAGSLRQDLFRLSEEPFDQLLLVLSPTTNPVYGKDGTTCKWEPTQPIHIKTKGRSYFICCDYDVVREGRIVRYPDWQPLFDYISLIK
jgi:hypothetical protein